MKKCETCHGSEIIGSMDVVDAVRVGAPMRCPDCAPPIKHYILIGHPGVWKVQQARKLIQPSMPLRDSIQDSEHARLISSRVPEPWVVPFRAPHHSIKKYALTGELLRGGKWRPGELSLAHGGVLLIDEVQEWRPDCLAAVRNAMLAGRIMLFCGDERISVPAVFRVIATAQPCPCGYRRDTRPESVRGYRECKCTEYQARHYMERIPKWLRENAELVRPPRH